MRAFPILAAILLAACAQAPSPSEPAIATPPPLASLEDGVWLKGDLHIHSRHSKDSSNNPVSTIIGFGESVGMDFLAITDHDNHVGGDVAYHTWVDPEFTSSKLLLLYGAEWTAHRGHGTPLSATPYDHQKLYDARDQRDVKIGALKEALGIHLSANHPGGTGDGFGLSYDLVDSLEVWNSAVWSRNANSMTIWDDMLKSGRKLTGRGGSDSHHGFPPTPEQKTDLSWQAPANNVGTPTTWVFATARSSDAVIAALTNGRVSVSANPYAPRIAFYADHNSDGAMDMMMGDNALFHRPARRLPGSAFGRNASRRRLHRQRDQGRRAFRHIRNQGRQTSSRIHRHASPRRTHLLSRDGRGDPHRLSAGP
ncbi:MAG TPA: CehA/McbA family metallohydrolase [Hyphomonadaceae bacterium]|nr:CehA/McbA family metallohydrolase [Hyphomonadaceae bacterium]